MEAKSKQLNQIGRGWNLVFNLLLIIVALIILLPMGLIVIVSFSSEASIGEVGYTFFPSEFTLDGYKSLFQMGDQLVRSYIITIFMHWQEHF